MPSRLRGPVSVLLGSFLAFPFCFFRGGSICRHTGHSTCVILYAMVCSVTAVSLRTHHHHTCPARGACDHGTITSRGGGSFSRCAVDSSGPGPLARVGNFVTICVETPTIARRAGALLGSETAVSVALCAWAAHPPPTGSCLVGCASLAGSRYHAVRLSVTIHWGSNLVPVRVNTPTSARGSSALHGHESSISVALCGRGAAHFSITGFGIRGSLGLALGHIGRCRTVDCSVSWALARASDFVTVLVHTPTSARGASTLFGSETSVSLARNSGSSAAHLSTTGHSFREIASLAWGH